MAVIEELRAFGADVDEGVNRCVNNEEFYLKMVRKAMDDTSFDDLARAISDNDLGQAFEIAHALKGVLANLSLTPLCDPVSEIVEPLRNRTEQDYGPLLEKIAEKRDELLKIIQ